jgi:hypothetical protein
MRVGVCIPGIAEHIYHLKNLIDCLERQTRKPDLISISISGYDGPELKLQSSIPIRLLTTNKRQNASCNRNLATAQICDDVDILVYMDMDDLLHPVAIQQTIAHFETTNADCFLHGYLDFIKKDFQNFDISRYPWPEISGLLEDYIAKLSQDSVCSRLDFYNKDTKIKYHFPNGHLTIKTKVWRELKWPEEYYVGEDCEYNSRLFANGYKYIFSTDILSLYGR